jgi:hypothetical protein
MQYRTNVTWDTTLTDLVLVQSDANTRKNGIAELVISAVKMTTGAPTATANRFIPGAIIQNSVSALVYVNTGSTASPVWTAFATVIAGEMNSDIPLRTASIATTGNTDDYVIAPETGSLASVDFSSLAALAASDSNYVTFSITNLGQAGAGTNPMLAATAVNTTQVTGGTALSANTKRSLALNGTASNLLVTKGDRLLVRAAATGTLVGAVTFPTYMLRFTPSA